MGFLKKFFRNTIHAESQPLSTSSFDHLSDSQLEAHLEVCRYGDFLLTDAVRPSYDLKVVPTQTTPAKRPEMRPRLVTAGRAEETSGAFQVEERMPSRAPLEDLEIPTFIRRQMD